MYAIRSYYDLYEFTIKVSKQGEIQMIIDYVNRTKKQKPEPVVESVLTGICALMCVVLVGLLAVML